MARQVGARWRVVFDGFELGAIVARTAEGAAEAAAVFVSGMRGTRGTVAVGSASYCRAGFSVPVSVGGVRCAPAIVREAVA